ncbi:phosphatidylinositol-glycan biosynthesis class W protein isoform X2 [Nematostella vectensis]|uniref:phosphatidylinositol-glycan biosynthesis class W protein isoform X2 n=1 Tax=Nematostella vectensis TaxID=45351 RepID=UPI00207728C4|nr:phosphatidylinositol-glycan biosynthesis class W protein isoform X2 [Nematostella vectensis]
MADARNLTYRELQQLFVSNLNGTTLSEIAVVVSSAPLAVLLRTFLGVTLLRSLSIDSPFKSSAIILLDYATLVFPVLMNFTIMSEHVGIYFITMVTVMLSLTVTLIITNSNHAVPTMSQILQSRMSGRQPFICNFRAYVLIATAISILAVDFKIFPRRFAKAETYGSGLMDVGVGAFVVSNAIVSREARQAHKPLGGIVKNTVSSIRSGLPLLVLGMMRCVAVKSTDYQEHVSEYGVHWNFFLTLFVVRVLSSFIVCIIPGSKLYGLAGFLLAILYQYFLSNLGLKQIVLYGSNNDGSRNGLLDANREGLVSNIGDTFASWMTVFFVLFSLDALFWIGTLLCSHNISPVSRRLANLSFVLWQMAYNIQLLASFLLVDLLSTAVQTLLRTEGSPAGGCEKCYPFYSHSSLRRKSIKECECQCLIAAINRNQLVYFLLANILTGAVNFLVQTLYCGTWLSFLIICGYMFAVNLIALVLHSCNITLRV